MVDRPPRLARRAFLRLLLAGAVGRALAPRLAAAAVEAEAAAAAGEAMGNTARAAPQTTAAPTAAGAGPAGGLPASAFPLAPRLGPVDAPRFLGPGPARAHALLWGKGDPLAQHSGTPLAVSQRVDVVVVGGGLAGLTAAHALRRHAPLLLEQAAQLGGNCIGEFDDNGRRYALGAAYLVRPLPGSPMHGLLDELQLLPQIREEEAEALAPVLIEGRLRRGFWQGVTAPKAAAVGAAAGFAAVRKTLRDAAIEIPPTADVAAKRKTPDLEALDALKALDAQTFAAWLAAHLPKGDPNTLAHSLAFLRNYCRSSFAAEPEELSAAQALSFIGADLGGIAVLPGGNATLADTLARRLATTLPPGHLRPGAMCLDITPGGDGVRVTYVGADGRLATVLARACVMAAPKFVARRICTGLPSAQAAAMARIRYRAYAVVNVMIAGTVPSPGYDAFSLDGAGLAGCGGAPFTDVVFAGWAARDGGADSALTLYRPYPCAEGRLALNDEDGLARIRREIGAALPGLLQALGIAADRVQGLRVARFGHALPLAAPGLIGGGIVAQAAAPWAGRVFFANQDNWANPAAETAVETAFAAARAVELRLARR